MKHLDGLDGMFRFLALCDISLDEKQCDQFGLYLNLLKKWSVKQNLVSKNDVNHLVERHFIPSTYLATCLPEKISGPVMDLGSGAGFPGVVVKILQPHIQMTLLDSSRKKILFLQEVCEQLNLKAKIVCARCEDFWDEGRGQYQIVMARAVARIRLLLKLASPIVVRGGRLITIKGVDYKEELAEVENIVGGYRIHVPDGNWLSYVNYLKDKCVIDVEM